MIIWDILCMSLLHTNHILQLHLHELIAPVWDIHQSYLDFLFSLVLKVARVMLKMYINCNNVFLHSYINV